MLNRGFTLLEILVSLVILTFGLLGLAGLLAKSQRATFEAYQRQHAIALANDMVEKIMSNRARAGDYVAAGPVNDPLGGGDRFEDLTTGAITDCGAVGALCGQDLLAIYDIAHWDGLLAGSTEVFDPGANRVGGMVNGRGCIEVVAAPVPPSTLTTYRVTVVWQGRDQTAAPVLSACGDGLYGDDRLRRAVSLDVRV